MCIPDENMNPTEECKHYILVLRIMIGIFIVLGILNISITKFNELNHILLMVILILMVTFCLNYTMAGFLILMSIFFCINDVVFFLLRIQNSFAAIPDLEKINIRNTEYFTNSISLVAYFVTIYYSFALYKELLHMLTNMVPFSSLNNTENVDNDGRFQNRSIFNPTFSVNQVENRPAPSASNFQAFRGQGTRLED